MNPKLKETVQFFPIENNMVHVYDAESARHFKMGTQEVAWLRLLDGHTPVADLRGKIPLEYFDRFMAQVARLHLLAGSEAKKPFSPFKIKLLNLDPNRAIDALGGLTAYYRLFLQWASLPLFVANVLVLSLAVPQVDKVRATLGFSAWTVAYYFLAILVSGLVHEGSHALVARSYNVRVPRVGMMLFVLHPSFYADVSGINLLSRRDQRVMVLLAGVLGNNLLVSIGLACSLLPLGTGALEFLLMFVGMNSILMFINLVPFVEFDGYYIFQELLGEPRFSHNALANQLGSQKKRIEYALFFYIGLAFQFVMISSTFILLRRAVLFIWDSAWVDAAFLALIVISYPALMLFRIRSAR